MIDWNKIAVLNTKLAELQSKLVPHSTPRGLVYAMSCNKPLERQIKEIRKLIRKEMKNG